VPVEAVIFFAEFRTPRRTLDMVLADVETWRAAGAAGVCIDTMNMGLQGADQHIALVRRMSEALGLGKSVTGMFVFSPDRSASS
jgi:hypothetical protein